MRRAKPEKQKEEKLNLVPIMDAVFILIFFLLFSTKFIEMYEINADTPVVKEVPDDQKPEKDPLNLIIQVKRGKLTLTAGLDEKVKGTYRVQKDGSYKFKALNLAIAKLRRKKLKEQTIIIRSAKNVKYKTLVKVMDSIKDWPEDMNERGQVVKRTVASEAKDAENKYKVKKKMFENIVLESF